MTGANRVRHANVTLLDFQILVDHLKVGLTVWVHGFSPAHDYETLIVPLVEDLTAVVESNGVVCE